MISNDIWIGIDPGVNGAIGLVSNCGNFIAVEDMPKEARGKKSGVDPVNLAQLFTSWNAHYNILGVCIELVHSMPKQGVASSFNFGESYGLAKGVVAGCSLRTMLIAPSQWKREYKLIGKTKDESRRVALSYYPDCGELTRKKDADRAEALLLARYMQIKVGKLKF